MSKLSKQISPGPLEPLAGAPAGRRALDWSLAVPLVVYGLLSLACATAILVLNHGVLTYTLDDGYIHLTLARNILRGHYGINPQEFAAPSSSILWPFLLAPFSRLAWFHLVPLALSLAASLGVIVCLHRLAAEAFAPLAERRRPLVAASTTLLLPLTNLVGLPWTGMEHSLQVLLALLVLMGLLEHHRSGTAPWWLAAAIVLGPLVRYENLTLSAPALLYLWWHGQHRSALLAGALLAAALAGFSLFLASIGQGVLPTSVVAKSFGSQSDSFALRIADSIASNLLSVEGCMLLLGTLLLLRKRSSADAPIALVVAAAAGLHFLIGKFGWFSRYEIYIWTVALAALLFCYRAELLALTQPHGGNRRLRLLVPTLLLLASLPYLRTQVLTPLAANNIYEQQFQISRFIADFYQRPVAVNDLGLTSFLGGQYVLDFYGLGSRSALALRESEAPVDWMDRLAGEHAVRLAILYEDWFPSQPASWIPLGDLYLGRARVSAFSRRVRFFALDAQTARQTTALLLRFSATLPDQARFVFRPGVREQFATPSP